MYHIAVYFDIPQQHQATFIQAALEDGRNSAKDEPGTLRFELIRDSDNPDRFYLNEAYESEEAFNLHVEGQHFKKFFDIIGDFADGPHWLIKGTRIEDKEV